MSALNWEYVLLIVGTITVVSVLSYIFRKLLKTLIDKNSQVLGVSPTAFVFIKNSISLVLYLFGIFWIFYKIPYFKSLGSALFAGAGIFTAIIAFASQKAFSDIIGGLFILIFKPFRVNDIIEVANYKGTVEEITLRHTVIKNYEFRRVVIPNSIISSDSLVNSTITDEKIRKHIEFGIAYDADLDLAISIIRAEIEKHPDFIDNRSAKELEKNEPPVLIRVVQWADSAIIIKAYAWSLNNDVAFGLQCDVLYSVKKAFDRAGIEIPYPHRTIVYKNK